VGDVVDQLLARDDVSVSDPAPISCVDALGERFGTDLPSPLTKLWKISDGVALASIAAHILGPTEVTLMLDEQAWPPELVVQGFLPLLDDHQSNVID
jgi:hypothetical protein